MGKRWETKEKILEAVGSGARTSKEIREKYKEINAGNFWWHKEGLKERGLLEEDDDRNLSLAIPLERRADKKACRDIFGRIALPHSTASAEAVKDLKTLLENRVIYDVEIFKTLLRNIKNSTSGNREDLIACVGTEIENTLGTHMEEKYRTALLKDSEALAELLDAYRVAPETWPRALQTLAMADQEKCVEEIVGAATDPHLEVGFFHDYLIEIGDAMKALDKDSLASLRERLHTELQSEVPEEKYATDASIVGLKEPPDEGESSMVRLKMGYRRVDYRDIRTAPEVGEERKNEKVRIALDLVRKLLYGEGLPWDRPREIDPLEVLKVYEGKRSYMETAKELRRQGVRLSEEEVVMIVKRKNEILKDRGLS